MKSQHADEYAAKQERSAHAAMRELTEQELTAVAAARKRPIRWNPVTEEYEAGGPRPRPKP